MKRTEPKVIEIKAEELQETLQLAATAMGETHYERIKAVFEAYAYVTDELGKNRVSLSRLKKLIFGAKTEKTEAVVGAGADAAPPTSSGESAQETDAENEASKKRKGHGSNPADAYRGAEKVPVPHPSLEPGDDCPKCQTGTVYNMAQPKVLVRLVGQAPVKATVYQLQRLR